MAENTVTIHTVGHGNRALDELVRLLTEAGIDCLVDIRAVAASRRHPHFSQDNLRAALDGAGIVYHWAGRQLGGFRQALADSRHTAIADPGLRAFADHMETDTFRKGVAQLMRLAQTSSVAILCAEFQPRHCHRNLVADYLMTKGIRVRHLIAPGTVHDHVLTESARTEGENLIYDGTAQRALRLDS